MSASDNKTSPEFLREDEMKTLLYSEKDPITSHLMQIALNTLIVKFWMNGKRPITDFDGMFFLEVIRSFCSDHVTLRTILAGEGDKLIWFPDEEST